MNKSHFIILLLVAAISVGCLGTTKKHSSAAVVQQSSAAQQPQQKRVSAKSYGYRVVAELPHSTDAYTQGLQYVDGYLWEGTGGYGGSELTKTNMATGQVEMSTKLGRAYFGEGITVLDGKVYQITWHEHKAFVYDAATLRRLKTFDYLGEGWGLTTDGTKLYMTDGTDRITVRDADTFEPERTFSVRLSGKKIPYLNELEWIEGEIWANVYMTNEIVRIDPSTGNIVGIIDLSGIQSPSDIRYNTDVLNGIAYDSATGRIWVTGKNWNKIYQIELTENGD